MVFDSKSSHIFTVKYIAIQQQLTDHAQGMTFYSLTRLGYQTLYKLKDQCLCYNSTYHLIDTIEEVQKRGGEYEVLVSLLGFEKAEDDTWKTLKKIFQDYSKML